MKRNPNSTIAAFLLVAVGLAGCAKHQDEKAAPPHQPKPAPVKPAVQPVVQPALPVQKQMSSATQSGPNFDFSKKKDPFRTYAAPVVQPTVAAPAQPAAPRGDQLPIQSFEVSKFKVVGIVAGLRENRALVVDPAGKGYVVQEGMQIGNANGRITKITPYGVEVTERYREENGRIRQRKVVLMLAKKR